VFRTISDRPWVLWLDTALEGDPRGRYSFLAVDPFRVLRGRAGSSEWVGPDGTHPAVADPLTELDRALARYRVEPAPNLPPFAGGAAGMFGYELAGDLEVVPRAAGRDLPVPDLEIGLYDLVVGWDRTDRRCWIVSTGAGDEGARSTAEGRLEEADRWLAGGPAPARYRLAATGAGGVRGTSCGTWPVPGTVGVRSNFTPEGYRAAVARAIEWIRAGDVYQVNLSQRFEARSREPADRLYLRLRGASPAPFGAFFSGAGFAVLSTSPELFLRLSGSGRVETRPIKGTRPRGCDEVGDARLASELRASVKDRAENLMIVDLLRNDLSRVCAADSVAAEELFRVESYRTVHHLVSTVSGRLLPGRTAVDLLRAAFPSGSVTGAPKIRAMEIIAELEPVERGPYCGALGYLGFGGDMDTSVSIRIAVAAAGRIVFHAGGGVVADSDPQAEYEETLDKARALFEAVPEPVP